MYIKEQFNAIITSLSDKYTKFKQKNGEVIVQDGNEFSGFEQQILGVMEEHKNHYKYDSEKVYNLGDIVVDLETEKIYLSISDNNNQPLVDSNYWTFWGGEDSSAIPSRIFGWARVVDNNMIESSGNITYTKDYNDHTFEWAQDVHNNINYSVEWTNMDTTIKGNYSGSWIFAKEYAANKYIMTFSESTDDDTAKFTVVFWH